MLPRVAADMAGRDHAVKMRAIYTSRATQMDTLVRHYEGEAAPTLVAIFNGCRATVEGHADLRLLNKNIDPKVGGSLREITAAVERASQLTRQLLAFSRKQIIQLQVVDLNELVSQLSSMLIRLIGEHVTLQCQYKPELPKLEADTCSIEQVVLNLAVNARDAMPNGGKLLLRTDAVTIDAQYRTRNPEAVPGQYVCLRSNATDAKRRLDGHHISRLQSGPADHAQSAFRE